MDLTGGVAGRFYTADVAWDPTGRCGWWGHGAVAGGFPGQHEHGLGGLGRVGGVGGLGHVNIDDLMFH